MNQKTLRILFTSAGRRVELTQCFRSAAERLGVQAEIHACDMAPDLSAACHMADASFTVPRADAPDYVEVLGGYCEDQGIDLLVPTIDPELWPLSLARERFAEFGTKIHVSSPQTIEIVRDKRRTCEVLGAAGIPVPRTGTVEDVRTSPQSWDWPLFIKPSGGSASRGIGVLNSPDDLAETYDEPMIVQDCLEGDEYTINMYVGADGELRSAIPHLRRSIRAGEVEKGTTVRSPAFREIAERIASVLPGAAGALCFQLIDDPRKGPRVFEINARFGGGYPLADRVGGRYAESLLSSLLGKSECASDDWREGVTMIRYDAAVFDG